MLAEQRQVRPPAGAAPEPVGTMRAAISGRLTLEPHPPRRRLAETARLRYSSPMSSFQISGCSVMNSRISTAHSSESRLTISTPRARSRSSAPTNVRFSPMTTRGVPYRRIAPAHMSHGGRGRAGGAPRAVGDGRPADRHPPLGAPDARLLDRHGEELAVPVTDVHPILLFGQLRRYGLRYAPG